MIKDYFKTVLASFVLIGALCLMILVTHLISGAFNLWWGFAFCIFSIFVIIIPAFIWYIDKLS